MHHQPAAPHVIGGVVHELPEAFRVGRILADQQLAQSARVELSDAEARSLQLSLRLFCRLCRFLQAFPEASSEELCGALHDGMLTPFMPAAKFMSSLAFMFV